VAQFQKKEGAGTAVARRGKPGARIVAGGGAAVPMGRFHIVEPKCHVCQHPSRREIDMQLALGWSRAEVRRFWNHIIEVETGEADYFKKSSIENHANKHLSSDDAAHRRILETRARLEGIDVDLVEGFILTKQGVAENLLYKGLEALQRNETVVEPKEILGAIDTLMKLEEKRSVVAEEVMLQEIRAFMKAVKRNVDEETLEQIYIDYRLELGEVQPAIQQHSAPEPEETKED
jgi:hypothetical protein